MAGQMQRNHFSITLAIKDPGTGAWTNFNGIIWDSASGGDVTSSINKYQPGGGQKEVALSSKKTRNDLVISKICDVDVDWGLIEQLEQWAGAADASITIQATHPNFDATGIKPRTIVGKLAGVNAPQADSTSEDAALLSLTFAVTA